MADADTLDADVPDATSGGSYSTDEGLVLADAAAIWAAGQFLTTTGVYFYSWIPLETTDDDVTLATGDEVTVWAWGFVTTKTDNVSATVVLAGASTLGLAFASALFAANMF